MSINQAICMYMYTYDIIYPYTRNVMRKRLFWINLVGCTQQFHPHILIVAVSQTSLDITGIRRGFVHTLTSPEYKPLVLSSVGSPMANAENHLVHLTLMVLNSSFCFCYTPEI